MNNLTTWNLQSYKMFNRDAIGIKIQLMKPNRKHQLLGEGTCNAYGSNFTVNKVKRTKHICDNGGAYLSIALY